MTLARSGAGDLGGIGFGMAPTTLCLSILTVAFVTYLAVTRKEHNDDVVGGHHGVSSSAGEGGDAAGRG